MLSATLYLVSYRVFFSLFMVFDLIWGLRYNLNFLFLRSLGIGVLTFYAKLPLYGLHQWLPKAHVECLAWGSSILAGIVLKFRTFSILRHKIFFFVRRLLCLKCLYDMWFTSDFKVWVAYSSISHITLVFCRFVVFYELCYVYYFVPHTLLSGLMFFYFSKDYFYLGSWNFYYFRSSSLLFLCVVWCGVPLFVNFLPELMILSSFFKFQVLSLFVLFTNFAIFFFVLCKFVWRSLLSSLFRINYQSWNYLLFGLSICQFWLFI